MLRQRHQSAQSRLDLRLHSGFWGDFIRNLKAFLAAFAGRRFGSPGTMRGCCAFAENFGAKFLFFALIAFSAARAALACSRSCRAAVTAAWLSQIERRFLSTHPWAGYARPPVHFMCRSNHNVKSMRTPTSRCMEASVTSPCCSASIAGDGIEARMMSACTLESLRHVSQPPRIAVGGTGKGRLFPTP